MQCYGSPCQMLFGDQGIPTQSFPSSMLLHMLSITPINANAVCSIPVDESLYAW